MSPFPTAPTPTDTPVTAPRPTIGPEKRGPAGWVARKRPVLSGAPVHSERVDQQNFDAFVAGAKFAGKWEDDWPQMTEAEFFTAIEKVKNISLGGESVDGSTPSEV